MHSFQSFNANKHLFTPSPPFHTPPVDSFLSSLRSVSLSLPHSCPCPGCIARSAQCRFVAHVRIVRIARLAEFEIVCLSRMASRRCHGAVAGWLTGRRAFGAGSVRQWWRRGARGGGGGRGSGSGWRIGTFWEVRCAIGCLEDSFDRQVDRSEGVKVDRGGAAANVEKLWKELGPTNCISMSRLQLHIL
jgi:hypothetical protein